MDHKIVNGVVLVSEDGETWREATVDDRIDIARLVMALREAKRTGEAQEVWGHTSAETAIVVGEYPYGRLRTLMRYWHEHHPKRGVRWVSQTLNPKTGRWNKPHPSTYAMFGTLVVTPEGHVERRAVGECSTLEQTEAFLRSFGSFRWSKPPEERKEQRARLKVWCAMKARYCAGMASGKLVWTINGEARPETEESKQRHAAEADRWAAMAQQIVSE